MSVDFQLGHLPEGAMHTPSDGRPRIIGLYGIPRSGKTYLLNELRQLLGEEYLGFYEGSMMIDKVTPGGLMEFESLDEHLKHYHRTQAISVIQQESIRNGKTAIVTGHFMLWSEEVQSTTSIWTEADSRTFTHILYLDTPAEIVEQRYVSDVTRLDRPVIAATRLRMWQDDEKSQLRSQCYERGILFTEIRGEISTLVKQVCNLLWNFQTHSEMGNLMRATKQLDLYFRPHWGRLDKMLVIDGDRTLSTADTGRLFWKGICPEGENPLKTLFGSSMGYSYTAFRQAALLYEELSDDEFNETCQAVASSVSIRVEFISL